MDPNAPNQNSINKPTMNPNAPSFHPTNPFIELSHFDLAMQPRVSVPPSEANSELPMIARFNGSVLPDNYDRGQTQNRPQEQTTQQENNGRIPPLIQSLWNERLFVTHFLALIVTFAHLVVFIIVALNS